MDENRHRHTVWIDDDVWDQVESHYQKDNCAKRNEFIAKAIRFYSGYLDAEHAVQSRIGPLPIQTISLSTPSCVSAEATSRSAVSVQPCSCGLPLSINTFMPIILPSFSVIIHQNGRDCNSEHNGLQLHAFHCTVERRFAQ